MLQPVHRDDVVAVVLALVSHARDPQAHLPTVLDCVGPTPLPMRDYLLALSQGLGLSRRPLSLGVPEGVMRAAARVAGALGSRLVDADAMHMLLRGNHADSRPMQALLDRPLRPAAQFIAPAQASGLRLQAQLAWLLPVLRWSVAAVWIWTGIVSLGVYPRELSLELLARVGATGAVAELLLYGAAVLDLLLGLATLWAAAHWRSWLWRAQAALVLGYTVLISWRLPEF